MLNINSLFLFLISSIDIQEIKANYVIASVHGGAKSSLSISRDTVRCIKNHSTLRKHWKQVRLIEYGESFLKRHLVLNLYFAIRKLPKFKLCAIIYINMNCYKRLDRSKLSAMDEYCESSSN